jgi:hypothetical protein
MSLSNRSCYVPVRILPWKSCAVGQTTIARGLIVSRLSHECVRPDHFRIADPEVILHSASEVPPAFARHQPSPAGLHDRNQELVYHLLEWPAGDEFSLTAIRDSTYSGRPLDSAELTHALEREAHRPLTPQKRRPKRRPEPGREQDIFSFDSF